MMGRLRAAWRWLKREILLAEITSYEGELLALRQAGDGLGDRALHLRCLLSLAYARLDSDEFSAAPAAQQGEV